MEALLCARHVLKGTHKVADIEQLHQLSAAVRADRLADYKLGLEGKLSAHRVLQSRPHILLPLLRLTHEDALELTIAAVHRHNEQVVERSSGWISVAQVGTQIRPCRTATRR